MGEQAVLAGDIGGTKTTLALFSTAGRLLQEKTYKNKSFNSLDEILSLFLQQPEAEVTRACFGIAGPVQENRVRMTNLDWTIEGGKVADQFGIGQVLLVNDLVATTAGAAQVSRENLVTLNNGHPIAGGVVGVLAPGTGLGQSFAVPAGRRLAPFPSEGGHSSFAPRNRQQIKLLQFMLKKRPHVSVEQVCSGMAIPDLYAFITVSVQEPEWLRNRLAAAGDKTPTIVQAANAALAGGEACEPAVQTMRLFVDILAAESANLALKVLATGGIFLGGGLPPRILPFIEHKRFMEIFCRGVYRKMLAEIPIHIITDPRTALIGARELAMAGCIDTAP